MDSVPLARAAPYATYLGNRQQASWCFDKEMAEATERIYQHSRGKKPQHLGFRQKGQWLNPQKTHANYQVQFRPETDGITFHVQAAFTDSSRVRYTTNHARALPSITRICGPVKKLNDTTFQISFLPDGIRQSTPHQRNLAAGVQRWR